jgi:hypothetical protein
MIILTIIFISCGFGMIGCIYMIYRDNLVKNYLYKRLKKCKTIQEIDMLPDFNEVLYNFKDYPIKKIQG